MSAFIYVLRCPISKTIRYVGKAINPYRRWCRHIGDAVRGENDHHTARWIRQLNVLGLVPELLILRQVRRDECWQDIERLLIAMASDIGWKLTNSTHGGEGIDINHPHIYAKWYRAMKEVNSRPDVIAKKSEAMKAQFADPIIGAMRRAAAADPVKRQKISESRKVLCRDPEVRAGLSTRAKEINLRPGVRERRSVNMKDWWANPDNKRKLSANMARRIVTIDGKTQSLRQWARESGVKYSTLYYRMETGCAIGDLLKPVDDEKQANYSRAAKMRNSPEYRAAQSEKQRAVWAKRKQS